MQCIATAMNRSLSPSTPNRRSPSARPTSYKSDGLRWQAGPEGTDF